MQVAVSAGSTPAGRGGPADKQHGDDDAVCSEVAKRMDTVRHESVGMSEPANDDLHGHQSGI